MKDFLPTGFQLTKEENAEVVTNCDHRKIGFMVKEKAAKYGSQKLARGVKTAQRRPSGNPYDLTDFAHQGFETRSLKRSASSF
jgi:hypothetical protein